MTYFTMSCVQKWTTCEPQKQMNYLRYAKQNPGSAHVNTHTHTHKKKQLQIRHRFEPLVITSLALAKRH
jgi:hypothetical protein